MTTSHHKGTVRLPYYAYNEAGAYFVTIVTAGRSSLFGRIEDGVTVVNDLGRIVIEEWLRSAEIRPGLNLDEFVLMPNHIHGIVWLTEESAHGCAALPRTSRNRTPRSISSLVAGFKAATTKRINTIRGTPGQPVWQPKFYEHVIRSDRDLHDTREYIANNSAQWQLDQENPDRVSS